MSTEAELAEVASACQPVRHALLMGEWVGEGRAVTDEDVPLQDDIADLAAKLGVATPETFFDSTVPEPLRAWGLAHELGFVEIDDDRQARAGVSRAMWHDYPAEDTLSEWLHGLVATTQLMLGTIDNSEASDLVHSALETLPDPDSPGTAAAAREALEQRLRDEYTAAAELIGGDVDLDALVRGYSAGLPVQLRVFGAVDDNYAVTSLGRWAQEEIASWDESDTDGLEELSDRLTEAGVDPDDPEAVREWLEQHPEELAEYLGDLGLDGDEDDFGLLDLKEAFGLPDELPPMSLPARAELARTARTSDAVGGDADDDTAIASWRDELFELLSGSEYLRGDDLDPEAVDAADEFEMDFTAAGTLFVMRLFLDGPTETTELRDMLGEAATVHLNQDDAARERESWLRDYGDPAEHLTARLTELGAVTRDDDTVRLTPLGRDAIRQRLEECEVSVPLLPPAEEMSVADLVSAVEAVDEQEMEQLTTAWLSTREPAAAAEELLSLARDGSPAQRMVATTVTSRIDPAPTTQWEAALDTRALRPHAKMALAGIRGMQLGEAGELDLDSLELGWLLTDTLAATTDGLGDEELAEYLRESVPPAHQDSELFESVWRSEHSEAHTVLTTIGRHHPDAGTAKSARKAAFKASSALPRS